MKKDQVIPVQRTLKRKALRSDKRKALNSEEFKAAVRQTVHCKGELTTEEVYNGVLQALTANHGELALIASVNGMNYFTNIDLTPLFNLLQDAAEKAADEFNKSVTNEIAKRNVNRDAKE